MAADEYIEIEEQDVQLPKLPDGTVLSPHCLNKLNDMNKLYTHINIGGKHVVTYSKPCQVQGITPAFDATPEFKKKFLHEPLLGSGAKKKNQGQAWLEWRGKNYKPNGTGFYPGPTQCPEGVYNFFQGYRVKPVAGDCSVYLHHLKMVICASDELSYNYLIGWLAHLFQRPDQKPNVAIVLKSVEGTGKGTMVEPILKILGIHGNKTNGAYAIAGRFNGVVANRLLIFADEVDLTDKHVADRLKSIITETSVNLERKGLEIEPLPNYCRLIFASNHARVLNAGIKERRYLLLEPLDSIAQDTEYFKKLWAWIHAEHSAAYLLHYFLSVDISEFNPFKCPQTKALISEKLENLPSGYRFILAEISKTEPFSGVARISVSELIEIFVNWCNENSLEMTKDSANSVLGKIMKKMDIVVLGRSDRGGKYYEIPDKVKLVQVFCNLLDIADTDLDL